MKLRFALFFVWLSLLSAGPLMATTVTVPLRFEYGFLRQALLAHVYNTEGSLTAFQNSSGCTQVILSDPRLSGKNGQLHLSQQAEIKLGAAISDQCTFLIDWRGRLSTWHQPKTAANGSVLRFPVVASRLYDKAGTAIPTGPLLEQARRFVEPRLNNFSIDLKPALAELKAFLPQVLPKDSPHLASILNSLAVTNVMADSNILRLTLRSTLPELPPTTPPELPLTTEELTQWEKTWEQWDAFLTTVIKQAAADTNSPLLRQTLGAILLDARYLWREALAAGAPERQGDPVRAFFLETWDQLAPAFGALTAQLPLKEGRRYMAFVNAVDMLKALDALGPALGLEISSAGLRRLARLLIQNRGGDPLQYQDAVDPELRRLFGLPPRQEGAEKLNFLNWLVPPARATQVNPALAARLNGWAPNREDAGRYLPLAQQLLVQVAEDNHQTHEFPSNLRTLYQNLVLAAAWQESCWRQFIKRGGKVRPLVSASGDVGILQINIRVWRGIYNPQRLHDDIAYNAWAGSEILRHYLIDYALAKEEHRQGDSRDALARSAYAMYNGGPRHISRYRKRETPTHLRQVDQAFLDKYKKVQREGANAVAACYGEGVTIAQTSIQPTATGKATTTEPGSDWIKRQNPRHYTLQLLAVQDETAAKAFLDRLGNHPGTYYRFRRQHKSWYAVIVGVYPNRAEAERAAAPWRRKLSLPNIWIRDFGSLQQQIDQS